MITMLATVVQAWGSQVLVTDNANGQEILVLTNNSTSNLVAGDQVRIVHNGVIPFFPANPAPASSGWEPGGSSDSSGRTG